MHFECPGYARPTTLKTQDRLRSLARWAKCASGAVHLHNLQTKLNLHSVSGADILSFEFIPQDQRRISPLIVFFLGCWWDKAQTILPQKNRTGLEFDSNTFSSMSMSARDLILNI